MKEGEEKQEIWGRNTPRGMKAYVAAPRDQEGEEEGEEHRKQGVATFIGKRLAALTRDKDIVRDEEGRFLAIPVRTLTRGVSLWLINIYGPCQHSEREGFWNKQIPQSDGNGKGQELHQRHGNHRHRCKPDNGTPDGCGMGGVGGGQADKEISRV